jgi:hypothetical protein
MNKAQADYTVKMGEARTNTGDLVRDYGKLNNASQRLQRDFAEGKIDINGYTDAMQDLRQQYADHDSAISKSVAQEKAIQKAWNDTKAESYQTQNAWEKLGLSAFGADGKLKNAAASMPEIANAFKGMAPGLERDKVGVDLFGDSFVRLKPYLEQGADGIKKLDDAGKKMFPTFSQQQLDFGSKLSGDFTKMGEAAGSAKDKLGAMITPTLVTFFDDMIKKVDGLSTSLDNLNQKAAKTKQATEGIGGGGTGGGGTQGTPGKAGGGYIRGAGTGTSDSIFARLSHGEYVLRAAAVRRYGVGLLHALNSLRLSRDAFPGFAGGGMVGPVRSGYAFPESGQAGAGGRPFVLQLGAEQFAMTAPNSTIDQIERYAVRRATASAGRKPSWIGGR